MRRFLTLFFLVLFGLSSTQAAETRTPSLNTGHAFMILGVPVMAAGFVGLLSATSWTPLINDQKDYISELEDLNINAEKARGLLGEMENSRGNLKTISFVMIAAGGVSFIYGLSVDGSKRAQERPLTLSPSFGDGTSINATLRF